MSERDVSFDEEVEPRPESGGAWTHSCGLARLKRMRERWARTFDVSAFEPRDSERDLRGKLAPRTETKEG